METSRPPWKFLGNDSVSDWKTSTSISGVSDSTSGSILDLHRLENLQQTGTKLTARCPACANEGADRKGNHLVIYPSGKYGCVARAGDSEHTRQIASLVGLRQEQKRDSFNARPRYRGTPRHRSAVPEKTDLTSSIQRHRDDLCSRWAWTDEEIWHDSPLHPEESVDDPRVFLACLFQPDALLWTGTVKQSGETHRNRWRSLTEWFDSPLGDLGPMTTPAIWRPGSFRRTRDNIATSPYVVLDFDGPTGWSPRDTQELDRHRAESLALVRWLREKLHWNLAAIIHTGSKSIHAWFQDPGKDAIESLRDASRPLGIDTGLIGHPEHPCRLPGQRHQKTGRISRVLWLDDIHHQPQPHRP